MADSAGPPRQPRGLIDTCVVIGSHLVDRIRMPVTSAICAVTLAELASGLHTTSNAEEQASRQLRLRQVEATMDTLPFDVEAAHTYGSVTALVRAKGRNPRGRVADLQIASVAIANGLPLYTRNPKDFVGLEAFLTVVAV